MRLRALNFLRCPTCLGALHTEQVFEAQRVAVPAAAPGGCSLHGASADRPCQVCWGEEIALGIIGCDKGCKYPIVAGVPRMEPSALARCASEFAAHGAALSAGGRAALEATKSDVLFRTTRTSFSLEWDLWKPGDKTWIWDLEERKRIFAEDVQLARMDRSQHKVVLDAGCGNGQLSAGIGSLGFEVVGLDLSSGVERAQALKGDVLGDRAPFVHYVQGNLANPPFAPRTFDIVYSAGVLHHTPNTEETFRKVLSLTKQNGRGYVWLYSSKRKPIKRLVTRALRVVTVRLPPDTLRTLCVATAPAVNGATSILTKLGIRHTAPRSAREMAVSMYDEFSPPYQHHHREAEVQRWYESMGFREVSLSSVDRNGFGMAAVRLS